MKCSRIIFCAIFLIFLFPSRSLALEEATVTKIIDGDTIHVNFRGKIEKVRLIGIDAPESEANDKALKDSRKSHKDIRTIIALGQEATRHMKTLIKPGKYVDLEFDADHHDDYGRLLAYVYTSNHEMLNEIMIRDGYATLMTIRPNTRHFKKFKEAIQEARSKHHGLWGRGL